MADTPIILRLTLADPVPGVRYSLQKDDAPFEPVTATDAPSRASNSGSNGKMHST